MNIKWKKDDDLTKVESEVLGEAMRIVDEITDYCEKRITNFLNDAIKNHNGLDQILVYSFFGKIVNIFFCRMVNAVKMLADNNGDNEITIRLLCEEFHEGNKIMLGLTDIKSPADIKKLN